MRIGRGILALALCGLGLAGGPAVAAADPDDLRKRHAELKSRLDALDASVRARVRRELLDQVENWRSGLEEFDSKTFRQRLEQAFETARSYGMDVTRLQALYDSSRLVLLRADLGAAGQPIATGPLDRLVGFIDWAGWEQGRIAEAQAKAQQHKVELHRKLSLAFIEALLERDPKAAEAKFRAYAEALRTVASAEADALVAEAEALAVDIEQVEAIAASMPLVGDAIDISALVEGRAPLTGAPLSRLDWALTLLGVAAGPLDQLVKRVPLAQQVLDEVVSIARELADPLVSAGRYSRDQLAALVNRFGRSDSALAAARDQSRRELAVLNDQAVSQFNKTPEGARSARIWSEANAAGAAKVAVLAPAFERFAARTGSDVQRQRELAGRAIRSATSDPEWRDLADAYIGLRQDKRALTAIKDADSTLRDSVFDFERVLFGTVEKRGDAIVNLGDGIVDRDAIGTMSHRLKLAFGKSPFARDPEKAAAGQIETWIKRHAVAKGDGSFRLENYVDPGKPNIEVLNVTNRPPKRGDVGMDRDITYRLVLRDGARIDLPAGFVAPHYQGALYAALKGNSVGATPQAIERFARDMDHAVTDGYVLEAYRPGIEISDFVNRTEVRIGAAGAEDLASTVAFKGHEWFERGLATIAKGDAARGWSEVAEGMRQLTKQFRNQIAPRMRLAGMDRTTHVPPRLGQAIELMARVDSPAHELPFGATRLNPAEAEAAIKAMGYSDLDAVATELGQYFEAVIKSYPRGVK
ncbi:MAG: hypothetical protein AB7G39_14470 [Alphaproteobacteria bacterium]